MYWESERIVMYVVKIKGLMKLYLTRKQVYFLEWLFKCNLCSNTLEIET